MEKKPGEPGYTGPFTYVTPAEMNRELERNGSDIRIRVDQTVPYAGESSNIRRESTETMGDKY